MNVTQTFDNGPTAIHFRPWGLQVGENQPILVIPGILDTQSLTTKCFRYIGGMGGFSFVNYGGGRFDKERTLELIRELIRKQLDTGGSITIVGISLGGVLGLIAAADLINEGVSADRLKLIMIDSPWGADTMKELPSFARGIAARALPKLRGSNPGASWKRFIMRKLMKGPKPDEIEIPSQYAMTVIAGRVLDQPSWRTWVVDTADGAIKRQGFDLWLSQVGCLLNIKDEQDRAAQVAREADLRVGYVACLSPANVTVDQPRAYERCVEALPYVRVVTVHTPHAALLQYPESFRSAFESAMRS